MNVDGPSRRVQVLAVGAALLVLGQSLTIGSGGAGGEPDRPDLLCIHGGSSGALWLVQMDGVARELELAPAQIEQFALWAAELRAETRRLGRGLLGGTGSDHEQRVAEKAREAATLTESFHRRVVERLTRPQQVRLDELYVRYLGARALFEPRVVARLELSESQQQALRSALGTGTPPPYDELLTQLTAPQREQLSALQGRPFTFPKPRFIQVQPGQPGR